MYVISLHANIKAKQHNKSQTNFKRDEKELVTIRNSFIDKNFINSSTELLMVNQS